MRRLRSEVAAPPSGGGSVSPPGGAGTGAAEAAAAGCSVPGLGRNRSEFHRFHLKWCPGRVRLGTR